MIWTVPPQFGQVSAGKRKIRPVYPGSIAAIGGSPVPFSRAVVLIKSQYGTKL